MPDKYTSVRGSIHVDKALTDFSLKLTNGALIADILFPRKSVNKESDLYYVYDQKDKNLLNTLRANGAPANQIDPSQYSTVQYVCAEHALMDVITKRDRANADTPLDIEMDAVENLVAQIMLKRESRAAALCVYANFATSGNRVQLSGTQQWNNASFDSDSPVDAIEARIDVAKERIRASTGLEPNTIIIPAAVAKIVKRDASIRDLIKYTQNDLLVNGDLPPSMFNMRVVIPGSIYNSATLGQTFTGADMWGKAVILAHVRPQISLKTVTFGATFEVQARITEKWYDADVSGDKVRVSEIVTEKVVCESCGYIIDAAIA